MKRLSGILLLAGCALTLAAEHGLPIGATMPAFEAQDQSGKPHSLSSLLGPNGAVLVFYRSADW